MSSGADESPDPGYGHDLANDRWIAEAVFPGVRGGFFVEAGACGGGSSSATLVLERELGWYGICVEPVELFHRSLVRDRRCRTDHRCLADRTGERVEFLSYVEDPARSGIRALNKNGDWAAARTVTTELTTVETVTLNDLLDQHDAPRPIHYLCLDVEGSEEHILSAFDFAARPILAISVEGSSCDALLAEQGYQQVLNPFPKRRIGVDHYFLHPSIAS